MQRLMLMPIDHIIKETKKNSIQRLPTDLFSSQGTYEGMLSLQLASL